MKDAKDKVLAMVQDKKISAAEGEALLKAMEEKSGFSIGMLFNPFEQMSEPLGMVIALVVAAAASVLAVTMGIRFDGFLDIHAPMADVNFLVALFNQAVAWPVAALVIWAISLPFSKQGRIIDFAIGIGVARLVQTLGGAILVLVSPPPEVAQQLAVKAMEDPASVTSDLVSFVPMIIAAIIFITWFITSIVFAIKHATGLSGGKLAAVSVLGIIVGETVSKLVLALIPL